MFELQPEQLKGLYSYSYKGIDQSLLSKYILQPYWNRLVLLFPLWMAPNLMTLIGFISLLINLLFLFISTDCLQNEPSSLMIASVAASVWFYFSMDAIDGKQARRTGSSSPLGELFDHGCDAMNVPINFFFMISCLGIPLNSALSILFLFVAFFIFYLSTWEEYHTGVLYLGYVSGPVEGLVLLNALLLVAAFHGTEIWNQTIFNNFRAYEIILWTPIVGAIPTAIASFVNVFKGCKKDKNLLAGFSKWLVFVSFLLLNFALIFQLFPECLSFEPCPLKPKDFTLFLFMVIGVSLAFSHEVGNVILSHVTCSPLRWGSFAWFPLIFGWSCLYLLDDNRYMKMTVISFYCAFMLFIHSYWLFSIVNQISSYLGIYCFKLGKRSNAKPSKNK